MKSNSLFKQTLNVILSVGLLSVSACSASSAATGPGIIAGLVGAGAGVAAGSIIDETYELSASSMAVLGGAGAALGLIAGALIYENQQASLEEEKPTIRKASFDIQNDPQQREIDALRRQMEDDSVWGRSETKSWNDRYLGDNPSIPYQTPGSALSNEF